MHGSAAHPARLSALQQHAATDTPRIAQPCACERLVRLLGCVCAAAGWLRRPATLPTMTHTLRCTRVTPIPSQDFEVHRLASDFFHGSGITLAHVPHTACFPQRSPHHSDVVATLPAVAICMALACCCPPSSHVTAAAASNNSHATHRTTMHS